jgi:flagellar hook assembly protein FlgD
VSRVPVAAFVALALATVGAFFLVQRLKATTPLIAGLPKPHPSVINPVAGGVCPLASHRGVVPTSFRTMTISFLLLNKPDDVDVAIVNRAGTVIDTLARGRHMAVNRRVDFTWDGHRAAGAVAPAGTYYVQVTLIHQHRTVRISDQDTGALQPVTVETTPAPIRITHVYADGREPAVFPPPGGRPIAIRFTAVGSATPLISVYRTDLPGRPRLVNTFHATTLHSAFWAGNLQDGRPAPQGTYLMSVTAIDNACTKSRFPTTIPPAPGSTPHAGVTVRYLAAQPPMTPVAPGATATVEVDSRQHAYTWTLRRAGSRAVLRSGRSSAVGLPVRLPGGADGLYELSLRWGAYRTTVPLVTGIAAPVRSEPAVSGPGRVLVVLPALTWQGLNPVDDDGDGLPNTLTADTPIRLARPLVDGLPPGFAQVAGLIAYLRASGRPFALTTDLSLVAGGGALLRGDTGVVLAGSERWLPAATSTALNTWVTHGGHLLSFGIGALQRTVSVTGGPTGQASDPSAPHAIDALSARPEGVRRTHGALLIVDRDRLNLFPPTAQALSGFHVYQAFGPVQAPARLLTAVGVSASSPAVIGYALGRGTVLDVGLPSFGTKVAGNVTAQELLGRAWTLLSR